MSTIPVLYYSSVCLIYFQLTGCSRTLAGELLYLVIVSKDTITSLVGNKSVMKV